MLSEREFNLNECGVKFKYLSQLVKNLLDKQDRKVSIKLRIYFYVKRVLDGPERVVTAQKRATFGAATQSIVYANKILKCISKTLI